MNELVSAAPAVDRAARLLAQLAVSRPAGWTLTELARATGLSKSTAHSVLGALVAVEWVVREADGRYRLGPGLVPLGQAAARADPLIPTFQQAANPLVERTGETVELVILQGETRWTLCVLPGWRRLRLESAPGVARPAAGSAVALASEGRPAVAEDPDEGVLEIAVALPVRPGAPRAVICLSGPRERLRPQLASLRAELVAVAQAMARALGQPAIATTEPTSGPLGPAELAAFLASGRLARLACVRPDGFPHTVPVWFEWDGAAFWLVARARAEWTTYLQTNQRVALNIDEDEPPFRRVLAEGLAEFAEPPSLRGRWTEVRRRMAHRYLAPDQREPAGVLEQVPHALIRIVPTKLTTWRGLLPHPRYQQGAGSVA